MKLLNGEDLAGFIKERQSGGRHRNPAGAGGARKPKLLILKDSSNPVIEKYVELKRQYGADIGVLVEIKTVATSLLGEEVARANADETIDGMIVQLPLVESGMTDSVLANIAPEKDVDGLIPEGSPEKSRFASATAEAILWLLNGYNIELKGKKIAIIGQGRLVGKPLARIFSSMGLFFDTFTKKDSDKLLTLLPKYDIVITATGVAGLIKAEMLKIGGVCVDAGTTSEDGVLVGDLDNGVREREDLTLTPRIGGVGPLTVTILFEHLLQAYATRSSL